MRGNSIKYVPPHLRKTAKIKSQKALIETKEDFEMRLLSKALEETREPLCNILSYAADFLRTQNDFNGRGYDRQKADILDKYSDLMVERFFAGRK